MEKRTIPPSAASFVVLFAAFVGAIVTMMFVIGLEVIRIDILHTNPHRSVSHALWMIPLMGPITGVAFVFVFYLLAVFAVMIWVRFLASKYGKVPFLPFFAAIPVYCVLVCLQYWLLPEFRFYTVHPDDIASRHSELTILMRLCFSMLPTLLFAWFCLSRFAYKDKSVFRRATDRLRQKSGAQTWSES